MNKVVEFGRMKKTIVKEMTADYSKELKELEKKEAQLAKKRKELLEQKKKQEQQEAKLETLFKNSGYTTPRELVEALIEKYDVKLRGRRASGKTRRKRTKVTPELRDGIKKEVKSGKSMNQVSKEHEISYAVVTKIMKGHYDKD